MKENSKSKLIADLKSTGLSEKAALLYAAILELGVAYPSKLAEVTKINRTTVYHILVDMAIKGLVTEIERGKKICYQIEKPSRLINFTKTQVGLAEERLERAKKLLPEIDGLFSLTPHKPRVRFFEGVSGILAIYEEHVSEKASYEMVAFSNVEKLIEFLPKNFATNYIKKKERLGITTRAIFPNTPFSKKYNEAFYRYANKKIAIKIRTVSADLFNYQSEITVFGNNKVSIINFKKEALIGVVIEDETITKMMRMIFELAWQGAAN